MSGTQNKSASLILKLYQNDRTVFRLNEVAMIVGESNFSSLNQKMNYYVRTGKLLNLRKGIYAKPGYEFEELACAIFTPCYISLEYVLQKAGIVFQYDPKITLVSYLKRDIEIENRTYGFRKIKDEILYNTAGIIRKGSINIASAERAFLDLLYLEKNYYFDNLNPLDGTKLGQLLPLYRSKVLEERLGKMLIK